MLKQYLAFFFYGLFTIYVTLLYWGFSAGAANWWPYVTLMSSLVLFVAACPLALFNNKLSSIIGLIALLATSPFLFNLMGEMRRSWNPKEHVTIILFAVFIIAIACYIIGVISSVKVILNFKLGFQTTLKKPIRIGLASIPLLMFVWWILTVFILR